MRRARPPWRPRTPLWASGWADRYLKQTGSHTGLLTVGAGHMVGGTGIVQGLKDLGYAVEAVPVP